jgi:hypothetical protein
MEHIALCLSHKYGEISMINTAMNQMYTHIPKVINTLSLLGVGKVVAWTTGHLKSPLPPSPPSTSCIGSLPPMETMATVVFISAIFIAELGACALAVYNGNGKQLIINLLRLNTAVIGCYPCVLVASKAHNHFTSSE